MFENIKADFITHERDILNWGFWALVIYRFGRWRYEIKWRPFRIPFSFFYKFAFFFIKGIGIELPCEVELGKNFRIDHQGGIVISGYTRFGDNCVIRNGVTIGLSRVERPAAPQFGDNVDIGTGAKVLGEIRIGNNVTIGANAVVIRDVPDNSIAVGVPAGIKPVKRKNNGTSQPKMAGNVR